MNRKASRDRSRGYHHGDLRNALILAAAELIEESGSVDFAMVDAARRAGVSSAAPYRHFKDKDALLDAVSRLAFFALGEVAQEVQRRHTPGSEDCIIAHGKAYIGFVTDHPEFYDLMWGDSGLRKLEADDPELKTSGFYVLVEAVEAWCEKTGLEHYNSVELSIKLWAMAHGLACLAMNHHVERFMPAGDVYQLLESSTHAFLDGLKPKKLLLNRIQE